MGSFCAATAERVGADRALVAGLEALAGGEGQRLVHNQRAWASITFEGTRHTFQWAFEGDHAIAYGEAMLARLPDHEFSLPGQLVADVAIVSVDHRLFPQPRLTLEFELLVLKDN